MKSNKYILIIILIVIFSFSFGFMQAESDYFFKISKSIEIFGSVYKNIALHYVDEIDPEVFMNSGIDGLLKSLDPYSTYIPSSEASDVELITQGKYGGIGITIGIRDGMIIITSLLEGYSAQRQGLQIGDQILEVDGNELNNVMPNNVRHLTRGEPGTYVKIKIKREGEINTLEYVLIREEIKLKNITYSDFIEDGIALIRLERFTRSAGEDLRIAIKDLKKKNNITGIILDLRDNPGGLLESAVDVVSKFISKGNLVVSTRGRKQNTDNQYFTTEEPMLMSIPLVILVNNNSASASEIVAGTIQDLDAGIILGTRTFGKGLVQNVMPLPYGYQLKLTTAKYYTPSGRCIQEVDYMHKSKTGLYKITPDTLRKIFLTKNGRKVHELGGILPDTIVEQPAQSSFVNELLRKAMFYRFANFYKSEHTKLPDNFSENTELTNMFKKYVEKQNYKFEDGVDQKIDDLIKEIEKSNLNTEIVKDLNHIRERYDTIKEKGFEKNEKEILGMIRQELMSIFKGESGRIESSIIDDIQIKAAKEVLKNQKMYKKFLIVN